MTAKSLEQRRYEGDRAREVIENEAYVDAFAAIRQEYTNAWMNSPARDAEGREKLYLMLKLTDKLQATLEAAMTDGKIASMSLEHQAAQDARERAYGVSIG